MNPSTELTRLTELTKLTELIWRTKLTELTGRTQPTELTKLTELTELICMPRNFEEGSRAGEFRNLNPKRTKLWRFGQQALRGGMKFKCSRSLSRPRPQP